MEAGLRDAAWKSAGRWVAVGAALLLVPGLGRGGLLDPWERQHAEVARGIAQDGPGAAFSPTYDGEAYLARPPLAYWLVAASSRLFGATEFAARLPAALSGIALAFACFAFVRRAAGTRAGAFAAVAVATTPLVAVLFRSALPEAMAVAASSASFLALAAATCDPEAPGRGALTGWVLLGLAAACGGLPAAAPPVAALAIWALVGSGFATLALLRPLRGAAIAAAVAAMWVVPTVAIHGSDAAAGFLRPDVAEETPADGEAGADEAGARPDDRSGFDRDAESVLWGSFPWVALLPAAFVGLRRRNAPCPGSGEEEALESRPTLDFRLLCLVWAAASFATAALLGDRWHHDPFLAAVPISVVAGLYVADRAGSEWSALDATLVLAGVGLLFLAYRDLSGGTALVRVASYFAPGQPQPLALATTALRLASVCAAAGALAWAIGRRRAAWPAWAFAAAALAWTLTTIHAVVPNAA